MERPTDPTGTDIHDVYAHFGRAMYAAQCVERQMVILAPALLGMHPRSQRRADLEALWDRMFAQTMGRTLTEFERRGVLPPGFEDRLKRAIALRNWLAHSYFWERAAEFPSMSGRNRMRAELAEAAEMLQALDDELVKIGDEWRCGVGVPDEQVAEELRQLLGGTAAV